MLPRISESERAILMEKEEDIKFLKRKQAGGGSGGGRGRGGGSGRGRGNTAAVTEVKLLLAPTKELRLR